MDFAKFDKQVGIDKLKADVEDAKKNGGSFPEIPKGQYMTTVDKLEIGETKDHRPMLKIQMNIEEGKYKKHKLFMNRVLYGTKNDANMIASALGFLESLEPTEDVGPLVFESYNQLNQLVLDIAEDIDGLEYSVDYDESKFNSISIIEAFEAD